ncbi:MAG: ATP-binding cassette domain-containing protein [Asticcacaulis sp.]
MIEIALTIQIEDFSLTADVSLPSTGISAIWGPSGSGKTSLLRAIAGLDRAQGRVSVEGEVWQDDRCFLPVHKRRLGYVFQEASLLPHLTVLQNLTYARRRQSGPDRFADIVEKLGVAPLLMRRIDKLSGGERQRVALARSVLTNPRLLLMDEPLSSLDQTARHALLPLIAGLDLPVLYVSHDAAETSQLADRVLHIENGLVRLA